MDHDDTPQKQLAAQTIPSPQECRLDMGENDGSTPVVSDTERSLSVKDEETHCAALGPGRAADDNDDDDQNDNEKRYHVVDNGDKYEVVEAWDTPPEESQDEENPLSSSATQECCEQCGQSGKTTWSCGSGSFPHYFCASCLCQYLRNEMGPFGKLETVVRHASEADQKKSSGNKSDSFLARASSTREDRTVATDSSTSPSEEGDHEGKKAKATIKQNDGEEEKEEEQAPTQTPEPYQLSFPGDLPCPRFADGECTCAAIPPPTIREALQSSPRYAQLLLRYEASRQRHEALIEEQHGEDDEQEGEEEKESESKSLLNSLRRDVAHALAQGVYVTCPSCGMQGHKSDGCMHMTCPCGTKYCYCCGGKRPCGCDAANAFIEYNPNWGNLPGRHFSYEEETRDLKALHEFHRRRTAYFLRLVKERYPPHVWSQFQQVDPYVLTAVPTEGRSIAWDEVDGATMPVLGKRKPPTPFQPQQSLTQSLLGGQDGVERVDEEGMQAFDLEQGEDNDGGNDHGVNTGAPASCCRQILRSIRLVLALFIICCQRIIYLILALIISFLPILQLFFVTTVLVDSQWTWFSALILFLSITFCCCFSTVFQLQRE